MKYKDKIINSIDNGSIDTKDLQTDFYHYLIDKGYNKEQAEEYTSNYFENLLTFKKNEINFKKWFKSIIFEV